MKIAIWVIAICEVVRALQNMVHHDTGARDNAYAEFVKSLKDTDEEFVENLLREFERESGDRKTEPQTDKEIILDPSFAELSDEQFVEAMKLIVPQTDCSWK